MLPVEQSDGLQEKQRSCRLEQLSRISRPFPPKGYRSSAVPHSSWREWSNLRTLRRADAKGEGAQAAIGAGMAIAADERQSWENQTKLWPHHMDDALAFFPQIKKANTSSMCLLFEYDPEPGPQGKCSPGTPRHG